HRLGRLWRAGKFRRRSHRAHPLQACRSAVPDRSRAYDPAADRKAGAMSHSGVVPAKAGTHSAEPQNVKRWLPAFVMTIRSHRRVLATLFGLACSALLFATPAMAVRPDEMLVDPVLEARAREVSSELRCLVCRNQSIDDSDADLAHD